MLISLLLVAGFRKSHPGSWGHMNFSRPELCENRFVSAQSCTSCFLKIELGKCLSILAAAAIALCVPNAALAKPEKAPDWVHEAAAQKLPGYPADTSAVVLLDDTTYTVGEDGKAVEDVRRVVKILRGRRVAKKRPFTSLTTATGRSCR